LSEHPLAKAIVKKAEEDGLVVKPADEFSAITGKGAFGRVDEQTYYIGNPRLFAEMHGDIGAVQNQISALQRQGKTVMLLGTPNELVGLIAVADQVREHSVQAVRALKQAGIEKTRQRHDCGRDRQAGGNRRIPR